MTNEQAKQEAIDKLIPHYNKISKEAQEFELQLKGIEDNNGWTRIEPHGSNLPIEDGVTYNIIKNGNIELWHWIKGDILNKGYWLDFVSHYKPIEKELLPVY